MMIKKKSGFLVFICSLIPGAGEMYMGFLKRGISIMSIFFFIIFLSTWLNLGPLIFILPIIWFYSFFQTHNIKSMTDEEFYTLEDNYIFPVDTFQVQLLVSKYKLIVGGLLIVIGGSILWNQTYDLIYTFLPHPLRSILSRLGYYIPQFIFGVFIIILGVGLIRGKKQQLDRIESEE